MKQKCSFILKTSIAIVLALMMLIGSISSVIAATVDIADTGADADDLASTGANFVNGSTIYLCTSNCDWWTNDSADNQKIKFGTGSYSTMTKERTDLYSATVPASGTNSSITFQRGEWNTCTVNNYGGAPKNTFWISGEGTNNGAWGYAPTTVKKQYVYFDNTNGFLNKTNKYFVVGHDSFYRIHKLNKVSGTENLYYCYNDYNWSDSRYVGVFSASNDWQSGSDPKDVNNKNWENDVVANADGYKALYNGAYEFSENNNVLLTTSAASNSATLTPTYLTANTALNSNLTVKTMLYSGSSYAETTTKCGTFSATNANKVNGNGTTTSSSFSQSTGTGTLSTARTNKATISQSNVTGYTFQGWKATKDTSGSGLTSGTYSFTNTGSGGTIYAYYKEAETTYSVSVVSEDTNKGTVASASVTAGASTSATLPTATPKFGYKFKNWTASGGGVTITNATSASAATVTATGTGGTVTANFEADMSMNIYIVGRFRVRVSDGGGWKYTGTNSGDWNDNSTNIKFTATATDNVYSLNTYCSLAELSEKLSNEYQYFHIRSGSDIYYPTSNTVMNTSGTTLGTTGSNNMYFNSSSTDKPVTIYFNTATKKIWYSIPDLYDVTVSTATGGSVTASPARCEEGTSVTLTISPSTGYQLSSITAKDSSNASVTLSGSGNTRTFTMPAKNVTVTPVFEKISYSVSVDAKYSNDGTNFNQTFPSGSAPTVTIGANTATQVDGTTVTAGDFTGYQFAGWVTNTGSTTQFGNQLDKSTTFKPTSGNTQAIARYKKIFNITTSVNGSGTGAGGAPTISVTNKPEGYTGNDKVLAGGSYTITANPTGSYSALDTIVVNNGTATTTSPKTVSSVSADQSVVVKYKSNVYLRGNTATIGGDWSTGHVMQANSDGTKYTKAYTEVASGTYEFKLYNGSYSEDSAATINITGGSSTATCTHPSNYRLVLNKQCNVTIESDGAKITSITVRPTTVVKKTITFKKADGVTITGSYDGTNFSTASADASVEVYEGDDINFTVTPASGNYISSLTTSAGSLSPAFAVATHNAGYTGKIANVTAAATVTPAAASKPGITCKTNKSDRGTVAVSEQTISPGETFTITVTEKSGVLKSLSYTERGANSWSQTTTFDITTGTASTGSSPASAPAASGSLRSLFDKIELAATGAALSGGYTSNAVNASTTSIEVSAVFDSYSAESEYYYNGYDTSGNALSGYHTKQMTEGMIGGEKYSYYHVEGRSGSDQLFTVSKGIPNVDNGYVYFTRPGSNDWNQSYVYAYFWEEGGSAASAWPGSEMSWQWNNEYGQGVYKVAIPDNVDSVIFNDNGSHQTVNIDLTNTNGAYYWDGTKDGSNYNVGTWNTGQSDQGLRQKGTEYFYRNTIYKDNFYSGGFYNHNTNSKDFIKPKSGNGVDWNSTTQADYYIVVLYPGKTYTIDYNGHTTTNTVGNEPMVIWMSELPGGDENITVYAKDGAIRSETFGSTYANIADTQIVANASSSTSIGTDHSGNISGQTYETYKATKGETIYIRTTINTTAGNGADTTTNRDKYYVRGFCINGEVFELKEYSSTGVYTTSYKIPEDYESDKIEVTPIYYLEDTTTHKIVTFRVTDFPKNQHNWGDTIYAYPFYGKLGSSNNAFGAYPGQPLVYYKGQYQIQIPEQSTAWDVYLSDGALSGTDAQKKTQIAETNVSGVTMSNGYYDLVHRQIMGYGGNGSSSDHVQTYDYGDFYKIYNENENVDNIVFDFKYEVTKHNFENQPAASISKSDLETNYGTSGNGFELLTNFHGRNVDLFGTPLSGDAADPSKTTPVYVVSIGGVNGSAGVENVAGYYATEWMVYGSSNGTNYTRITGGDMQSIPPEVLILNSTASFDNNTYPSAVSGKNITDWQTLYTNLEAYRGKPVYISYEAADAQIGSGNYATSGGGGATRNDGRWLYSKTGESITSNIKIQYSDNNGVSYTDLDVNSPAVPGLSAYFTNTEVEEGAMTFSTTIDPDKTFDFEAKTTNASYKFVGWFMDDTNKTPITTDKVGHTERSGSYTFIARFKQVTSGQLIIQHTATGTGSGSTLMSAVVKNADDETVAEYTDVDSVELGESIVKSENTGYKVYVTLKATPSGYDTYSSTYLETGTYVTDAKFYNNPTTGTVDNTTTKSFEFTIGDLFDGTTQRVNSLMYHSEFAKTEFTYNIEFSYHGRLANNNQSYTRAGTLTPAQVKAYVSGSAGAYVLDGDFITTLAPHESNFNETLIWNDLDDDITSATASFTKSFTAQVATTGEGIRSTARTATFVLPYSHTNGVAEDGVAMSDSAPDLGPISVTYGQLIKYNDDYITAPETVTDSGETKYFQYWEIYTNEADEADRTLVSKCFSAKFNYIAYDNYIIEPVYAESKIDYSSVDLSTNGASTSISYLETSRNQWNNNGNGGYSTGITARNKASDILFNDFALSYGYKDKRLDENNDAIDGQDVEVGFVVEKVQKMDLKQDGTYDSNVSKYIAEGDAATAAKTAAQAAVENITVSGYGAQAGGKNTAYANYTKYKIDRTTLDNKNRIEFFYALFNAYADENSDYLFDSKTANKNYVYRAYSYIKVGDTYYLSDDPAYFIMYDEATK